MAEEVPSGEGNLNFEVKPTPVVVNEYRDVIQAALIAKFRRGYDKYINAGDNDATVLTFINALLQDNNAIIAGGFLLNVINPVIPAVHSDIDCYVPCRSIKNFNKTMVKLIVSDEIKQYNASFYCRSFLRKNGIRSVQGLYINKTEKFPAQDPRRYITSEYDSTIGEYMKDTHMMDIMAVRNSRSPIDVVQNFDLTFCQIWYDGENVWATHPTHVREKRGVLQKDYALLFLQGNRFLRNRMSKYKKKGYIITFNKDDIDAGEIMKDDYKRCILDNRNPDHYKKWISRVLFYIIMTNKYIVYNGGFSRIRQPEFNLNITHDVKLSKWLPETKDISEAERSLPIAAMSSLNNLDGYDSDDYDITNPSTYDEVLDNFVPIIPVAVRPAWLALTNDVKFWKCINYMKVVFYSLNRNINAFRFGVDPSYRGPYLREDTISEIKHIHKMMTVGPSTLPRFLPYATALVNYAQRNGDDAISLDGPVPVYDLHNHTLDEAISITGLKMHLDPLIGQRDKSALPCYVTGCMWPLTLDEIMPIVDQDYYINFTEPIPEPLPAPSPLLGTGGLGQTLDPATNETIDLIDIIRDEPSDAGGWRNIYHHVMCPFCLGYMSRETGCTYVTHPNPEGLPYAFMPYCRPQNIVQVIKSKYTSFPSLEVCAQCGRPCTGHEHFDLADPPGIAPPLLTAAGAPDYERCGGGGRREGIARIIGVRDTLLANPGMDPDELRTLAALAAEAAASDPSILTRAATILATDPDTRVETNMDGGGRVGKVCGHGYGSYKTKIKMTRKRKQKKGKKGSRKN